MKSAFVTSSISRDAGGLFFAMTSLAKGLHDLGVEISTQGVSDIHTSTDAPAWGPVPSSAHPRSGPVALARAPRLGSALVAGGFDLLHTHGIWQWPSSAVHRWHAKTGNPYLVSPHGMLDPWALAQSRWKKRIAGLLFEFKHLRTAACLHALCESEAESIRAYGLNNPVCIIPNGVDLPEETEDRHAPRHKTQEKKVLLFLGRLHPKKGLANALRAWRRCQETGVRGREEWTFAIAGWDQGGHEAELKRLCDELGLAWSDVPAADFVRPLRGVLGPSSLVELDGGQGAAQAHEPLMDPSEAPAHDRPRTTDAPQAQTKDQEPRTVPSSLPSSVPLTPVSFLGPAFGETKDALLRSASAFILPSFSEGLPMAVLEAWSYRLPVLMTDHCNLPEGFAANAAIRIGTEYRGQGENTRNTRRTQIPQRGNAYQRRATPWGREQAMGIDEGMRMLMEMTDAEREAMGQNGRGLVERQFTWPRVAARMKEVYEWVLGGGEVPGCVRGRGK